MVRKRRPRKYIVLQDRGGGQLDIRRVGDVGETDTFVLVATGADGYGQWHCWFLSTGNPRWDVHVAKTAIGHELRSRGEIDTTYMVSVHREKGRRGDRPGVVRFQEAELLTRKV